MNHYAEARATIRVWRRLGLQPVEAYFAITGQLKIDATWDKVADLIVGCEMAAAAPRLKVIA